MSEYEGYPGFTPDELGLVLNYELSCAYDKLHAENDTRIESFFGDDEQMLPLNIGSVTDEPTEITELMLRNRMLYFLGVPTHSNPQDTDWACAEQAGRIVRIISVVREDLPPIFVRATYKITDGEVKTVTLMGDEIAKREVKNLEPIIEQPTAPTPAKPPSRWQIAEARREFIKAALPKNPHLLGNAAELEEATEVYESLISLIGTEKVFEKERARRQLGFDRRLRRLKLEGDLHPGRLVTTAKVILGTFLGGVESQPISDYARKQLLVPSFREMDPTTDLPAELRQERFYARQFQHAIKKL